MVGKKYIIKPIKSDYASPIVLANNKVGTRMKHADALSRNPNSLITTETTTRIRRVQYNDDKIKLIKTIIKNEPYEDYLIENDIVYKFIQGRKLLVFPNKMQNEIIKENHEIGHFGIINT